MTLSKCRFEESLELTPSKKDMAFFLASFPDGRKMYHGHQSATKGSKLMKRLWRLPTMPEPLAQRLSHAHQEAMFADLGGGLQEQGHSLADLRLACLVKVFPHNACRFGYPFFLSRVMTVQCQKSPMGATSSHPGWLTPLSTRLRIDRLFFWGLCQRKEKKHHSARFPRN